MRTSEQCRILNEEKRQYHCQQGTSTGLTSYNHSHNLKLTKFTCFLFYLHGLLHLSFKDTVVVPSLIIMNEFSTRRTDLPTSLVGERNGNPLQHFCPGNPCAGIEPGGLQSLESQSVRQGWATEREIKTIPTLIFSLHKVESQEWRFQ